MPSTEGITPSTEGTTGLEVDSSAAIDAGPEAKSDAAVCPHDLPNSCPSPEPSWMNDVAPIIDQACGPCHGVGGVEQPVFDFSTYQGVHKNFGAILSNVYSCLMPPPDAGGLTDSQRQLLLGWLVCAAPDN
jgi:hypothetical protein